MDDVNQIWVEAKEMATVLKLGGSNPRARDVTRLFTGDSPKFTKQFAKFPAAIKNLPNVIRENFLFRTIFAKYRSLLELLHMDHRRLIYSLESKLLAAVLGGSSSAHCDVLVPPPGCISPIRGDGGGNDLDGSSAASADRDLGKGKRSHPRTPQTSTALSPSAAPSLSKTHRRLNLEDEEVAGNDNGNVSSREAHHESLKNTRESIWADSSLGDTSGSVSGIRFHAVKSSMVLRSSEKLSGAAVNALLGDEYDDFAVKSGDVSVSYSFVAERELITPTLLRCYEKLLGLVSEDILCVAPPAAGEQEQVLSMTVDFLPEIVPRLDDIRKNAFLHNHSVTGGAAGSRVWKVQMGTVGQSEQLLHAASYFGRLRCIQMVKYGNSTSKLITLEFTSSTCISIAQFKEEIAFLIGPVAKTPLTGALDTDDCRNLEKNEPWLTANRIGDRKTTLQTPHTAKTGFHVGLDRLAFSDIQAWINLHDQLPCPHCQMCDWGTPTVSWKLQQQGTLRFVCKGCNRPHLVAMCSSDVLAQHLFLAARLSGGETHVQRFVGDAGIGSGKLSNLDRWTEFIFNCAGDAYVGAVDSLLQFVVGQGTTMEEAMLCVDTAFARLAKGATIGMALGCYTSWIDAATGNCVYIGFYFRNAARVDAKDGEYIYIIHRNIHT